MSTSPNKTSIINLPKPSIQILYLEDLDNLATLMKKDLHELGFLPNKILHTKTVASAIAALEKYKFNLIITDWQLPDGEGSQLITKARSLAFYKLVPILVCSSVDDVGNLLNAVSLGANDYLVKPWDRAKLEEKLKFLIPLALKIAV
jgi:two-component system chemotaxis response regulator CheY